SNYANGETTVVVADPVIATGVGGVCTSIVSPESSFTGNDIYQFSPFSFLTVEDMKEGNSIGGQDIDLDALASIKAFVFTKFNNLTSMAGGAKYEILSATDYSGTPDGFRDHYIGGDTQIVAKLVVEQYADVTQFGAVKDGVTN
ncbi:hypothetical protein, partial [Staphylococcus aureus]|uniref:hypothetical protein n=1 Tax=Staphylococcus aureus TaxID=1280 RepID=UPI0019E03CB1